MNEKVTQIPPYTPPHKVKEVTGFFGRTKALELEATDPSFPKRVKIKNCRLTAWRSHELLDWIESQAR